jgi:hypothetical protein
MIKTQHCPNCEATKQELSDFRQEVSDAVGGFMLAFSNGSNCLPSISHLIIRKPKPDPLVVALKETYGASLVDADALRAALDAAGFEIREKNDD